MKIRSPGVNIAIQEWEHVEYYPTETIEAVQVGTDLHIRDINSPDLVYVEEDLSNIQDKDGNTFASFALLLTYVNALLSVVVQNQLETINYWFEWRIYLKPNNRIWPNPNYWYETEQKYTNYKTWLPTWIGTQSISTTFAGFYSWSTRLRLKRAYFTGRQITETVTFLTQMYVQNKAGIWWAINGSWGTQWGLLPMVSVRNTYTECDLSSREWMIIEPHKFFWPLFYSPTTLLAATAYFRDVKFSMTFEIIN